MDLTGKGITAIDSIYYAYGYNTKKVINCAVCGKVEVPSTYTVYKQGTLNFCSYNHKRKYIREHPEIEDKKEIYDE